MPSPAFDPSSTNEECGSAGRKFGSAWGNRSRAEFEEALVGRLAALDEALVFSCLDIDEAVAAFDQAACSAWEVMQAEVEDDAGRRRGLWLVKK